MKKLLGILMLFMGAGLGVWVGYNLFVERQAGTPDNPLPAIVFAAALLLVGGRWAQGRSA